jgi:hypothetical protein
MTIRLQAHERRIMAVVSSATRIRATTFPRFGAQAPIDTDQYKYQKDNPHYRIQEEYLQIEASHDLKSGSSLISIFFGGGR